MKTTKRTSLERRIEKLVSTKELNKNSLVYDWVMNLTSNEIFRPVYSQGSTWKQSYLVDRSTELSTLLRKLNIDFSTGNDAPRGGKTGFFIKINTKILN